MQTLAIRRAVVLSVLCVGTVSWTGCGGGDRLGQVSGTVTLNGAPVAGAVVRFQPESSGRPSLGVTDSAGRYTLRYTRDQLGAEVGRHKVSISTFSAGDPDAEPPRASSPETVPERYNSASELTSEVKRGSNSIDFSLEGSGPVPQPTVQRDD